MGNTVLDAIYTGAFAALVTVAASQASRATVIILAAVAVVMSRGWLYIPSGVALGLAFGSVFLRRHYRRLNALVGALAIQVVLRWPPIRFHGSTALVAALAVTPVLLSAWSRQRRKIRKVIGLIAGSILGVAILLSVPVTLGALLARSPVNRGIAATHQALDAISNGNGRMASAQLATATSNLGQAHRDTGSWWTWGATLVPVVAQQRRAMAATTGAVHNLAAVAGQEATRMDFASLAVRHGQIDLAAIAALRDPLVALDAQTGAALRALPVSRSAWLVKPVAERLNRLDRDLARAHNSADLGVQAVDAAPGLLGGDGVRHYFVAFMTPAETRGLDGLLGAYGELTADRGRITLTRAGQIGDLNTVLASTSPRLTGLPQYVAHYGAFDPEGHFQDVTYSPDFPTVARVITELYPQAGGDHIDGVLALDPEALSALLRFTGPLSVAGLPVRLTPANTAAVLLRQQYTTFPAIGLQGTRHDFLQDALREAFEKLTSISLPNPRTLSATLAPVVREGRLLFWSNHPADQPLLHRLGIDGAFPQPGPASDLLAVTVSNAANNKVDAYLHERISDHVTYDPATGQVQSTVTLNLDNGTPVRDLPAYVVADNAGTGLPPGTSNLWLSLYSPLAIDSSTANGAVIGFSPAISELGVKVYSAFLRIPPESTTTLILSLDGRVLPGPTYRVSFRLQPLANPPEVSSVIMPTSGWATSERSVWTAGSSELQTSSWRFHRSR